jgi:hypothetical protein
LKLFKRFRDVFDQARTSRGALQEWFVSYIFFTILLGCIITGLVSGVTIYRKLQSTFHFSEVIISFAGEPEPIQPGASTLLNTLTTQSELAAVTLQSGTPPYASPLPQSTNTSMPVTIPYVQIASLVYAPDTLCSPIEGVEIFELPEIISQLFNVPNQLSDIGHHGVDLGSYNFHGQYLYEIPIRAILTGNVAGITVNRPPIGNVVILETKYADLPEFLQQNLVITPGESLYHFYGHMIDEPVFALGTRIECGEQINLLGKSQTVEAHLHLETRIGKSNLLVGPMAFYDAATSEEERAEYLWWRTSGELRAIDPMSIFSLFLDQ